jgi:Asp/Glu/hydantoin racemase
MPHLLYFAPTSLYSPTHQAERLEAMKRLLLPGFTIAFATACDGAPPQAERRFSDEIRAARGTVARISAAECDALILGAALDPEVAELRELAQVPVATPGEAALALSASIGSKLSIIVVDEHNATLARAMVSRSSVRVPIASIRSMEMPVRRILEDPEAGRQALRREAAAAVRTDGADVVYLGAMSLGSLDPASLRRTLGVPIVDPLTVVVLEAQNMVLAR